MKQALVNIIAIIIGISPGLTCWLKERHRRKESERKLVEAKKETRRQEELLAQGL
ncbi:MAG: hypothetical protein WCO12_03600 [bacterium]